MSERFSGVRAGNSPLWPCALETSRFVTLSIHLFEPERFQIDPIDGPHVHRHFPSGIELMHKTFGWLEFVHNWDTTRRTESVPAYVAPESVDGEMIFASELDVFFRWVNPEIGVLFMMFRD